MGILVVDGLHNHVVMPPLLLDGFRMSWIALAQPGVVLWKLNPPVTQRVFDIWDGIQSLMIISRTRLYEVYKDCYTLGADVRTQNLRWELVDLGRRDAT